MPLINLTTDLKTLQYGNDRPGGGSSGQPYVKAPVPGVDTAATNPRYDQFMDFYALNRNTHDFPIRGGSVSLSAEGRFTTPAGEIDRLRIRAFISDPQKGAIFLKKQVGLQLSNPKTQVPSALGFAGSSAIGGFLEITRVYSPTGINTLQQVSSQGTGTHIPRHGLYPSYTGTFAQTYEDYARRDNTAATNRLAILATAKLNTSQPIYTPSQGIFKKTAQYGISLLSNEILNYEGGPGSVYGIGNTVIKRVVNTDTSRVYNTIAFSYKTLQDQKTYDTFLDRAHPQIQDFRQIINKQAGGNPRQLTSDYKTLNREDRLKTGKRGAIGRYRTSYLSTDDSKQDLLNKQKLFTYTETDQAPWDVQQENCAPPANDMIKFAFECLDNDTPGNAIAILFRSFLTSFSDNNQAELNSFKYLGRGETFRTYQGFDRSISFGFRIVAFSRDELQPLYRKLNHLISQVYPDYSQANKFMRGGVVKLTIGDYLYRVPGFLESVNVTVDNNYSWEIDLEGKNPLYHLLFDNKTRQLPQIVDVQCSFKPIHNILPRRESANNPVVPLIADTAIPYFGSGDISRLAKQATSPAQAEEAAPTIKFSKTDEFIPPPVRTAEVIVGNSQATTVFLPSSATNLYPGTRQMTPEELAQQQSGQGWAPQPLQDNQSFWQQQDLPNNMFTTPGFIGPPTQEDYSGQFVYGENGEVIGTINTNQGTVPTQ